MSFPDMQAHVPLDEDVPWMDMLFAANVDASEDQIDLTCWSMSGGVQMGLHVSLPRYWSGLNLDEGQEGRQLHRSDAIVLTGIPDLTANLVNWMAGWPQPDEVYQDNWAEGFDYEWNHPSNQIICSAVHLAQTDVDGAFDTLRLKLFHERAPYFEVFLNIAVFEGAPAVSLNETDPEYRVAVQSSFARAFTPKVDG